MARILVIDDDEVVRLTLTRILENAGHEVAAAADGRKGVAMFDVGSADVVITDIFMPDQEGLGTIIELRGRKPDLKIIAMSGGGTRSTLDVLPVAEAFGAVKTMRKPFRPSEVIAVLDEVLGG